MEETKICVYDSKIYCNVPPFELGRCESEILYEPISFKLVHEHYSVETKINGYEYEYW